MKKLSKQDKRFIKRGICPDCGLQLYRGPRGGLALNVACINGHTFWVAPGFDSERIAPRTPGTPGNVHKTA